MHEIKDESNFITRKYSDNNHRRSDSVFACVVQSFDIGGGPKREELCY